MTARVRQSSCDIPVAVRAGPRQECRGHFARRARRGLAAGLGLYFSLAGLTADAGDILRGGASAGAKPHLTPNNGGANAASLAATKNARDALSRTTNAVNAVRQMQTAARELAIRGPNNLGVNPANGRPLSNVPNGLKIGGLQVAPGVPKNLAAPTVAEDAPLWRGASLPKQTVSNGRTNVTIRQNKPQAVLNWQTFNVGKETTLRFDQSAGKDNKNEWIAFNKVNDPSGVPSQILGAIEADGQVYVINRNGIIFGGSSQVNSRAFVASSLPINDNLINQGLLNNRDAQFLFSALPVPGGSDGTPAFNPTISDAEFNVAAGADTYTLGEAVAVNAANVPLRPPEFTFRDVNGAKVKLVAGADYATSVDAATKKLTITFTAAGLAKVGAAPVSVVYTPVVVKTGDVVVQRGAIMCSPVSGDGNGGRVMLAGSNVTNAGTISTPAGQAILAAGQQVAVAQHASNDPSLRGLDVWVGASGEDTGAATNSGLIESFTGSVSMSGRTVSQLGAIESSTTVNLNGRIDLNASYGAVGNPLFDGGQIAPPFLFQHTGLVTLGKESVTRILPEYASDRTIPGTSLAERSQINVTGLAVHFGERADMLAPSAEVSIRAGVWPYRDPDGNRTTLTLNDQPETGLSPRFLGTTQRFFFSGGEIYLDPTSSINVAGTPEVFVPLAQSVLDVELRGTELADSPLQRDGVLRAIKLTVDLRRSGVNNGRFWIGTPLGDLIGLAGIIERDVAQLTAAGGNVTLQSGGSIVVRDGATIDVSGGFYRHEAGMVRTTRVMQGGRLVEIADAMPDQIYDVVFTGQFTAGNARFGISETWTVPFMMRERWEESYLEGAAGGSLALTAPRMAIDGTLLGPTVEGPRQRSSGPDQSTLSLEFSAEKSSTADLVDGILTFSPTPPTVVLAPKPNETAPAPFRFDGTGLTALPGERVKRVTLSPEIFTAQGFGNLSVKNQDGDVVVREGVHVEAPPEGSLTLTGSNIAVRGKVSAPGGDLSFRALNLSPTAVEEFNLVQAALEPDPRPNADRGLFTLGPLASLSTAGLVVDDRPGGTTPLTTPLVIDGGNISIEAFSANLATGSTIDVSGGVSVSSRGRMSYGDGGSIRILTGRDLTLSAVIGGSLELGSTLRGFSGETGGSLAVRAQLIQIGGTASFPNTLVLSPAFFRQGGFTNYSLTGIGADSDEPVATGAPETYAPAISIAPGTVIEPVAESLVARTFQSEVNQGGLEISLNGTALNPLLKPVGQRAPVSISLAALGSDDDFTLDVLEARGDIVIGKGARIQTDPGASILLEGDTITLHGSLIAPGGTISLKGDDTFRLARTIENTTSVALPTVHIGPSARISTAGTSVLLPDAFGRRNGTLYNGGVITVFGNIVAESGAVLDASGATTTFDLHPMLLGEEGAPIVAANSGINSPLWRLQAVPTQLDSDGGLIELEGAQMLLSDATLLGHAGGPTAVGGTLSIHSGRFYPRTNGAITGLVQSTDINLVVTQSGDVLPDSGATLGIGRRLRDAAGADVPGMGYFAVGRFHGGGFDSLDLGAKYLTNSPTSVFAFGGNLEFRGPVNIEVPAFLRLAGGGVIKADATVNLSAPFIAIGQPFRPPLNPADPLVVFQQRPAGGAVQDFGFAPTSGAGDLRVNARLIEIGNLSLQNVGRAAFHSAGDIRGNGTLAIRGDLSLTAPQLYPTTLATFNLFAYDTANDPGSITIRGGGIAAAPLSAGGSLNVFASRISHSGILRAPVGSIRLGWDGTDLDPSDADLDAPLDPTTRAALAAPTAAQVTLHAGSMTSVSALDWPTGTEILLPFGLSPDGFSWIDPRGVNVTTTGLPEKAVAVTGVDVTTHTGSTIEIGGGGDFYGFRWISGVGGSTDILRTATQEWNAGTTYEAGDLVLFRGQTYAARLDSTGERPAPGRFWSRVDESFAVIPGIGSEFAPVNAFSTTNAALLQGEPGYVFTPSLDGDRVFSSLFDTDRTNQGMRVGDRISLNATPGLAAGTYTLLPRRYALYPGAFLITPQTADPLGTIELPTGATLAQGLLSNSFNTPVRTPPVLTRFEVASFDVTRSRAAYDDLSGNSFFAEAAERFEIARPQRLPLDAGYLAFHGNTGISLAGDVLAGFSSGGRGALIDVSSFADIHVTGGNGAAAAGAQAVVSAARLNSWGAESLLVGGLRWRTPTGTSIDVRTTNLFVTNPGSPLAAPEIVLAARTGLTLGDGAAVLSIGAMTEPADTLVLGADGTMLRASADAEAAITRSALPTANTPLLTIGAGARVGGTSLLLDSTFGTDIDPSVRLNASTLTLGSGQISIALAPPAGALAGSVVDPHLVLSGDLLDAVQRVDSLTLKSYRTIDVYGAGTFGESLGTLRFSGAGLRGFEQGAGVASFRADNVLFDNPSSVTALAAPAAVAGSIELDARTIRPDSNGFSIAGYTDVTLDASGGVLGQAHGTFTALGNLTINAPLITGTRGSEHSITATGALALEATTSQPSVRGGLGSSFTFTGASVLANSNVILPSGEIILRALAGDVVVGGTLSAAGTQQQFFDLIRYSDAGRVLLTSDTGNVELRDTSTISVASAGLGEAGTVGISAVAGTFVNQGMLLGNAAEPADSGTFLLDVRATGDYASVNDPLEAGGFLKERNLRIRTGVITVSGTTRARDFTLSADAGPITVTGTIDASGATGGRIILVSGGSLTLEAASQLTAHAAEFSSAGKGGTIRLEAGAAINGVANTTALLDLKAGSAIDLGVDAFAPGLFTDPASSAFRGQFQGTLHLRAPRSGNDIRISTIAGDILGASSILAEAFRIYDRTGIGTLDTFLRDTIHADSTSYINAGQAAMEAKLLAANAGLSDALVLAPGVEIVNRTGDLVLGTDFDNSANDWNLAGFRYGSRLAPGVLTLRAAGNVEFKNALSDGFAGDFSPNDFGEFPTPGQELWLRPVMNISTTLPTNTQSWSYRLTAGADLGAAHFREVRPLDTLAAGKGSILVGKFYSPNLVLGPDASTASAIDNRFQVVRTGAGSIDLAAGRDVQLRNQFATIYTAGVRLPYSNFIIGETEFRLMSIFSPDDFAVPLVELSTSHPFQGGLLGTFQQAYPAQYTLAGGDVSIFAQGDIGRFTMFNGQVRVDTSRQLPNNWLYRRGYVDPTTALFGEGGVGVLGDRSASTTWWVDFSNFFQGFGALGGGNVSLIADRNIINADAVAPTNARMPGRNSVTGLNLAPDASTLVELGGGDITIRAGNNIDGGAYYVERGRGTLFAGGIITTNSSRSPSTGILAPSFGNPPTVVQSTFPSVFNSLTWLPTTLFVGKSAFDVSSAGDILLGPVANPFFLSQGINNKFWYKTYFNTYSPDASLTVSSFGGSVTHRLGATWPGSISATPILQAWLAKQNALTAENSSFYEPWIRLAEADVTNFAPINTVGAPTLRSTAFAGDINIVGNLSLFPSAQGTLELAATGGVIGMQPSGRTQVFIAGQARPVTAWIPAFVNLSDSDPAILPGLLSPLAYRTLVANTETALSQTLVNQFTNINPAFAETGSYSGTAASIQTQQALHGRSLLHAGDTEPVRIYGLDGDIVSLSLFSAKSAQIAAGNDISDVAFYIQNTAQESISLVSAGRDIVPYNENQSLRSIASDISRGNVIGLTPLEKSRTTVLGTTSRALEGDIQISGPGVLEVFAGRNLDLGTGANLTDGTGLGIASIGNFRNPNLPYAGADLIILSGVSGPDGQKVALGLSQSSLNFESFLADAATSEIESEFLKKRKLNGSVDSLTDEEKAIVGLELFFRRLRDAGREFPTVGNYDSGFAAVDALFGAGTRDGEVFTRARDIRTSTGGSISIGVPGGGLTMASDIFGNPLTPPGVVTEFGGPISLFTNADVDIGQARIFTLRGGNMLIWSSEGDIAAGTAPKTVVTAPPTRVVIDATSADVQTDLGGLATGGGIGVLAAVEGVMPGDVDLIAPGGVVDAGDAGIRATGNLSIAAVSVLNASNISVSGSSSGVPSAPAVAAPNLGAMSAASSAAGSQTAAATSAAPQARQETAAEELPSIITVEVLGYGGGETPTDEEEEERRKRRAAEEQSPPA